MTTLTTKKKLPPISLSVVGALFLKKRGRRALSLLPVVVSLASSKRREVPSFLRLLLLFVLLQNVVVVKNFLFSSAIC